ncbi:TcpE family conjugal transfer membrane protein [Nocardiopsis sp. SBT366]|uniref:TcpE family conjugal transfer membrane protein n=1 Tax=Nocardiopsis sp. SBT366 TaxID=1580529 RepID=UPI00069FFE6B|nr:TcpE family conjugal transfer membrane protein [Nocardiopsis sp. SBT366]
MDLPTYTNIWRIEKRLYKLYDFRLPMPLPVGTFGVALGVFALWVVLLSILNAPFDFGNGWHLVLWVVPPGVITVLATRPVIEGKRLTELLISQARFLTEARVFTRLAPEYEPAEIRVSVRVWHRDPEAGPLPLTRSAARRAQAEQAAVLEAAPATEVEEAPVPESGPRAAPPLRGVPARQTAPVVEHDDSVEYTPARKVPVAVAAGLGTDTASTQEDDAVAEHEGRSEHPAMASDTSEEPRRGVGRRVLNYFGFGLSAAPAEEEARSDQGAGEPGDSFDEPLYVTEEDEQRDRDEWFARLRASSGETPLGLTSKSAYSDSDTGAMSSAELAEAVGPREPDPSRRRAEEMTAASLEQESPAARRLRGRTQGIQVARDHADRRVRDEPEPARERARQAPPARPERARGTALPDTAGTEDDRPARQRREGRPHATPWALEPEGGSRTDYPDLSDYAARFAAATGRPSSAGSVSAAPWLPPAAATPEEPESPEEQEPIGRSEAGPQVSHATHGLVRPATEDAPKPPLQLDHGTGEHEAMPVESGGQAAEHGTRWNEHMSVLDRHLIKADTPAPPRPKFADAVPSKERDSERRDPADWFDDGKRRHPDQPKVGDRDNPVIVVSELREERRAAAEARQEARRREAGKQAPEDPQESQGAVGTQETSRAPERAGSAEAREAKSTGEVGELQETETASAGDTAPNVAHPHGADGVQESQDVEETQKSEKASVTPEAAQAAQTAEEALESQGAHDASVTREAERTLGTEETPERAGSAEAREAQAAGEAAGSQGVRETSGRTEPGTSSESAEPHGSVGTEVTQREPEQTGSAEAREAEAAAEAAVSQGAEAAPAADVAQVAQGVEETSGRTEPGTSGESAEPQGSVGTEVTEREPEQAGSADANEDDAASEAAEFQGAEAAPAADASRDAQGVRETPERADRAGAEAANRVAQTPHGAGETGTREQPGPRSVVLTEGPKPPTQLDHGTGELVSFVEVRKDPRGPTPRPSAKDSADRPTETELAEAEAAALRSRRAQAAQEEPVEAASAPEPSERENEAAGGSETHDPHDGVFHRVAQNARRIGQLFGQPTPGEEPEPRASGDSGSSEDTTKPDLELDHGTGEQARLGDTPQGVPSQRPRPEPVPRAEEVDHESGDPSTSGGTRGWRRLAKVVTGGATPVRSDLPTSDIERLRTPLAEPRSLVVLGCTGGAGQTVTALMIGHTLAAHRDDRVVAVDVNPGPNGLSRRVGAQAPETLTALLANADSVDEYDRMRAYAGRAGTGLEVVQTLDDPYVQTLDDRDYGQLAGLLGGFYGVTLLDPAATGVARALPVADGLVLVAPASADAERAVSMTFEWLDGNGYATLRANSILVVNGVSKRSLQDVDAAERVARGRCRAIVRIPWDDHLGSSYTKIDVGALRPATKRAHGALGGVLVNALAPAT